MTTPHISATLSSVSTSTDPESADSGDITNRATDLATLGKIPLLGSGDSADVSAPDGADIVTVTGLEYIAAGAVGKNIVISGSANADNNGTFEITEVVDDTSVKYENTAAGADADTDLDWYIEDPYCFVRLTKGTGSTGFCISLGSTVNFGEGSGTEVTTPLNKSFEIRGVNQFKTPIYGGKEVLNIVDIGFDHDFHIEDMEFHDFKVRPMHLLRMRHCTVKFCTISSQHMIGRTGGAKVSYGQSEFEAWGLKIGCYKAEDGPHGDILIDSNVINLHTGVYPVVGVGNEDGTENVQAKGIQLMVCPPTAKATIVRNMINGCALRGIHVVDFRGFLDVRDNNIYMDAPYLHVGDLGEYHMRGVVSGSGIGVVNGFNYVNRPIDNGQYNFVNNGIFCKQPDMVGVLVIGIRKSRVGPITFEQNHISMVSSSGTPFAGVVWHGMDYASFGPNSISGNGQLAIMLGAVESIFEFGTYGVQFSGVDLDGFTADHETKIYVGADARSCSLHGSDLPDETIMFPINDNGAPLLGKCTPYGYTLVRGAPSTALQAFLDSVQDADYGNGIGYN